MDITVSQVQHIPYTSAEKLAPAINKWLDANPGTKVVNISYHANSRDYICAFIHYLETVDEKDLA